MNSTMKARFEVPHGYAIPEADEAFITGSVKEVVPVVQIGDQVVGTGKPGPVTRMLHHTFLEEIIRWLE